MQNIGKGSFSKVKKVIRTNKKETDGDETTAFAMKMMHKPALEKQRAVTYTDKGEMEMITQLDKVYNEVENWATVHHPNIIKLFGYTETQDEYILLMEYAGDNCNYLCTKINEKNEPIRS